MNTTVKELPWAKHRHSAWLERAHNKDLPTWFRVMSIAYGLHDRNGNVTFKAGELAKVLGITPQALSNALAQARKFGVITEASTNRLLIVPPDAITSGWGPGFYTPPFKKGRNLHATV